MTVSNRSRNQSVGEFYEYVSASLEVLAHDLRRLDLAARADPYIQAHSPTLPNPTSLPGTYDDFFSPSANPGPSGCNPLQEDESRICLNRVLVNAWRDVMATSCSSRRLSAFSQYLSYHQVQSQWASSLRETYIRPRKRKRHHMCAYGVGLLQSIYFPQLMTWLVAAHDAEVSYERLKVSPFGKLQKPLDVIHRLCCLNISLQMRHRPREKLLSGIGDARSHQRQDIARSGSCLHPRGRSRLEHPLRRSGSTRYFSSGKKEPTSS